MAPKIGSTPVRSGWLINSGKMTLNDPGSLVEVHNFFNMSQLKKSPKTLARTVYVYVTRVRLFFYTEHLSKFISSASLLHKFDSTFQYF